MQVMRHPVRRIRNTVTYLSVALLGTQEERAICGCGSCGTAPAAAPSYDAEIRNWPSATIMAAPAT